MGVFIWVRYPCKCAACSLLVELTSVPGAPCNVRTGSGNQLDCVRDKGERVLVFPRGGPVADPVLTCNNRLPIWCTHFSLAEGALATAV